MNSGIILIDKPTGCSSAAAVGIVKRWLRKHNPSISRVGHAGTLDPGATGLLIVLFGSATRLAHYAESGEKEYSGTITLGVSTTSDDSDGEVVSTREVVVTDLEIRKAVDSLTGTINQTPPAISAVKINGKRAYALARKGVEVALKTRRVTVSSFAVERVSLVELGYRVTCSKGTYIRSLARDLGEQLGCGGIISSLRREGSYPFSVKQAFPLSVFMKDAELDTAKSDVPETNKELGRSLSDIACPWTSLFPCSSSLLLPVELGAKVASGNQLVLKELAGLPTLSAWVASEWSEFHAGKSSSPYSRVLPYGLSDISEALIEALSNVSVAVDWRGLICLDSADGTDFTLKVLVNIP